MNYSRLFMGMRRGFRGKCPACGSGPLMFQYVTVADHCNSCSTSFRHQRADDAPPYFTIAIVAHIIVPLLLVVEKLWHPPLWLHAVLWLPATFILSLVLLPKVKGAIVGLQWAFDMHGFGGTAD